MTHPNILSAMLGITEEELLEVEKELSETEPDLELMSDAEFEAEYPEIP